MSAGSASRTPRVLVGVCGSIAAYKAGEVIRELRRDGALVRVVMTPAAARFVGPPTFAALSENPVHTDLFDEPERVVHVELARWADAYVVCAATASTLARFASGVADDLVSATYLMCRCPVLVAPAMHTEMWEHPSTRRNVQRLVDDGVVLVPPEAGPLASGDVGVGRLADPASITEAVQTALAPKDLAGLRVLVTAGPTREPIDPVRFLSNPSSGRMGFALARVARRRGAEVTLVCGPTAVEPPQGVEVVRVTTAMELLDACLDRFEDVDVVVKAAAVGDWRPSTVSEHKLKKAEGAPSLDLVATPDVAAELGRKKGSQTIVLFAAETGDPAAAAQQKLEAKHADLVVGNRVGAEGTGFEAATNDAVVVSRDGVAELPRLGKDELASEIWDRVLEIRRRDGTAR